MAAQDGVAIDVLTWLSSDAGIANLKTALSLLALVPAAAPETTLIIMALPLIQAAAKANLEALQSGLASGSILPDGQGGFVSKAWADDPRHALNPDGTFKYP